MYPAAEITGISDRHMRRWRERYEEYGYDGIVRSAARPAQPQAGAPAKVQQLLGLYREKYFDFNVRHFHEKLVGSTALG